MSAVAAGAGDLRIRRSTPEDSPALARLAQLDSKGRPTGEHLLAEEGGELRAALPLDGGPVIADPFHRTDALVTILELRAGSIRREGSRTARGARLRRRGNAAARSAVRYGGSPVPSGSG